MWYLNSHYEWEWIVCLKFPKKKTVSRTNDLILSFVWLSFASRNTIPKIAFGKISHTILFYIENPFTFFDIRLNDENDCGDTFSVPDSTGTSTSIFYHKHRGQFHMCLIWCASVAKICVRVFLSCLIVGFFCRPLLCFLIEMSHDIDSLESFNRQPCRSQFFFMILYHAQKYLEFCDSLYNPK